MCIALLSLEFAFEHWTCI